MDSLSLSGKGSILTALGTGTNLSELTKLLDPKEVTFALVKIPIGSGTFARHKVVLCVAAARVWRAGSEAKRSCAHLCCGRFAAMLPLRCPRPCDRLHINSEEVSMLKRGKVSAAATYSPPNASLRTRTSLSRSASSAIRSTRARRTCAAPWAR